MAVINRISSPMLRGRNWIALLLLAGTPVAGCGGNLRVPATVPVRGAVHLKGVPTPGIRVTFHSQEGTNKKGFVPSGETGPDGNFTLSTGEPNNGAPPGAYVVTFEKPEIAPAETTEFIETEVDALGGKYSDPRQSSVRITIQQGENVLSPFELE